MIKGQQELLISKYIELYDILVSKDNFLRQIRADGRSLQRLGIKVEIWKVWVWHSLLYKVHRHINNQFNDISYWDNWRIWIMVKEDFKSRTKVKFNKKNGNLRLLFFE